MRTCAPIVRAHRIKGALAALGLPPAARIRSKHFTLIVGNCRLAVLRAIHRGNGDPILRKVSANTADALLLAEPQYLHPEVWPRSPTPPLPVVQIGLARANYRRGLREC
jgi:hypothetical protein